jgi:hypothetical protein
VSGPSASWGSPPGEQPRERRKPWHASRLAVAGERTRVAGAQPTTVAGAPPSPWTRLFGATRRGLGRSGGDLSKPSIVFWLSWGCVGTEVARGPDSGDVHGMSGSVVRFCWGVRSCGGCSFGGSWVWAFTAISCVSRSEFPQVRALTALARIDCRSLSCGRAADARTPVRPEIPPYSRQFGPVSTHRPTA